MRAKDFNKTILTVIVILALPLAVISQTLSDAQTAYNAGVAAKEADNFEEAISQFIKSLEACEYLVEEEEDETAEELLGTLEGIIPKLQLNYGSKLLKESNYENGLVFLYKAKEYGDNYGDSETSDKAVELIPQAHYKMAATKYKESDFDGSLAEIEKALKANPNFASAYYLKAVIYKKKEEDEALKAACFAGIQAAKNSTDKKNESKITQFGAKYFLKKGNDAKGSSKYDEAVSYLLSSIEFDSENSTPLLLLASVYSSQKKHNEAIETAQKALAVEKGDDEEKAKIYFMIAQAYEQKGNSSAACTNYKKAAIGKFAESANYQIEHVLKCQ